MPWPSPPRCAPRSRRGRAARSATAGARSTTVVRQVPILLLAAGASTRLGRPKQLLAWRGEPLVRRAARAALESGTGPVLVLLGSEAAAVRSALAGLDVVTHEVAAWQDGIGATIAGGVREVMARWPDAESLILAAADQPLVEAAHFAALRDAQAREGRPMAASAYAGTLGIPALFVRALFPELRALAGDAGAARLLRAAARDQVSQVPCPAAEFDVDTDADVASLPPET